MPGAALPLVVEPATEGVNLAGWIASQSDYVAPLLVAHGALLFRGFGCRSAAELEQIMAAAGRPSFDYTYRSTPRKRIEGAIFSSTEYPSDQTIPLHNEMSYSRQWPGRLWLCCLQPAEEGGATPLADSRLVWRRISEPVRARFRGHGVRYVRNYGRELDLGWPEVFQTDDPSEVETFCRAAAIDVVWRPPHGLRTSQVCQAETVHPVTGDTVWFNQAHLFHVSSLPREIRETLTGTMPESEWPRNAYFGDGSPIPSDLLEEVRAAYAAETLVFEWKTGDVLLVDNLLVAHGRTPYRGERRVVVGMTA